MPEQENKTEAEKTETTKTEESKQEENKKTQTESFFDIKVNGQDRKVTLDELKEMASRSAGADAKFREAAELRTKAEKGDAIVNLFTKITNSQGNPSKDDISVLAAHLGLNPAEVSKMLEEQSQTNPTKKSAGEKQRTKVDIEDLPDELKNILAGAKKSQIDDAIAEVKGDVGKAIDKDEIFGKMISESESSSEVKGVLSEMIFEDVQRRILTGEPYGPDLVASSIQRARARVGKFSTHKHQEDEANLGILGFGPGGKLPSEVQADKPIERVSSTKSNYEENFMHRFFQERVLAARKAMTK